LTIPAAPDLVVEYRSHDCPDPARVRSGGIAVDVLGALLWLALTVWLVRVARTPAEAAPARDLLLAMGGVYALARVATVLHPWAVPAALLVAGSATAIWSIGAALSGGGSLFGYANAAAAFHVACAAAGLMTLARLRGADRSLVGPTGLRAGDLRTAAVVGTVACAVVPLVSTAVASTLLVLALPIAVVAREMGWRVRRVVVVSALAALTVIAATVAIAALYDGRGAVDWAVASALSGNRGLLWSEALDAAVAEPVTGAGTGRFSQASGTAGADTDLRWAHNAFLQIAAETGFTGAGLGLALLFWSFARMAVSGRDVATGVAAAGLAAMVATASIDYVWHYPGVALATAALAGSGPLRARPAHRDVAAGAGHAVPRAHAGGATGGVGRRWDAAAGADAAAAPPDAAWPRPIGGARGDGPQAPAP